MLKVAKEADHYLVSLFQVKKLNTLFSELISQQLEDLVSVKDRHVIFNLAHVNFIDTAGFFALERAAGIAKANHCVFQLCNITDEVQELIGLTGHEATFDIIPRLNVREKIVMELDE